MALHKEKSHETIWLATALAKRIDKDDDSSNEKHQNALQRKPKNNLDQI